MNSFIVYKVQEEYNSLEQLEINLKTNSQVNLTDKTQESKKKETEASTLVHNTDTCLNSIENSIFNQK